MFKTIVIGCDGSTGSLAAIDLAARLRDPDGGRLVLVSVFPQLVAIPDFASSGAEGRREAAAQEILQRSVKRIPAATAHETYVEPHASVAGGLNAVAVRTGADLMVLGPSHRRSVARLAGRMTVQRLLHGAPCAVAVAGQTAGDGSIVVAYDGSPESRYALAVAYALAARLGTRVQLCGVVEPITPIGPYIAAVERDLELPRRASAEAALARAMRQAPPGVSVTARVASGSAASELLAAAEDGAQMIVAGSRAYGILHRAIADSVSGVLLTRSEVPVLVIPRGSETTRKAA